jgi:hypothetical protein
MAAAVSPLIAFYRGLGPDAAGRTIDAIWGWDAGRLEMVHDYIQWLFPLPEPSRFNPDAPLLTPADAALFADDPDLAARLLRSFDLMLGFYGLARRGGEVVRADDFPQRAAAWLTPLNHNHLRLTRILLSLGHLGRGTEAKALHKTLEAIALRDAGGAISARTRAFWRNAVAA